jgi:MATE family multidrug resistance protein
MIEDSAAHHPPRLRDITVIALPMVVSQASETVMLFVDRLFLSRLGKLYIAASWSAGTDDVHHHVLISGNYRLCECGGGAE